MQCERCGTLMALGAETAHNGRFLCRKCYLDVLSPSGVCESWILRDTRRWQLTDVQQRIIARLQVGNASLADLAATTALAETDLESALGRLERLQMVRAVGKDGTKVFQLTRQPSA